MGDDLERVRAEVDRLTNALEKANADKIEVGSSSYCIQSMKL